MKDKSRRFILSTTSTDTAYLYLPGMKGQRAASTLPLSDFIENYRGPDINVDLTDDGKLIGIEVLIWETEAADPGVGED